MGFESELKVYVYFFFVLKVFNFSLVTDKDFKMSREIGDLTSKVHGYVTSNVMTSVEKIHIFGISS